MYENAPVTVCQHRNGPVCEGPALALEIQEVKMQRHRYLATQVARDAADAIRFAMRDKRRHAMLRYLLEKQYLDSLVGKRA